VPGESSKYASAARQIKKPPVSRRIHGLKASGGVASALGGSQAIPTDALRGLADLQCAQERALPESSAVRKLEPQPHAVTAFGLLTVKPAPMRVST
jgi:hypothetical protein